MMAKSSELESLTSRLNGNESKDFISNRSMDDDVETMLRQDCSRSWRRHCRPRTQLAPSIGTSGRRHCKLLLLIAIPSMLITIIILHTPALAHEETTVRAWRRQHQVTSHPSANEMMMMSASPGLNRAPDQLTLATGRRQLVKRQTTEAAAAAPPTTTTLDEVATTEGGDDARAWASDTNNNNNIKTSARLISDGDNETNLTSPASGQAEGGGGNGQQSNQSNPIVGPVLELGAYDAWRLGYLRFSIPVSVMLTIAYSCVFVVGILGNSFVVAIVCKSPRMRTVTNYFIANLALADILVLVVCLPATLVGNLFIPYVLGSFICKSVSYLQGVAVSASINTMVTVTMDRFLAICFPMDWHMSRRTARWMIAGIWLFSGTAMLPWAIYFTLVPYEHEKQFILTCGESWPNESWANYYFIGANLIMQYLFPALVIIVCYLGIWYKIERRNIPGERSGKGLKIELIMQKSKLKVVKMMMVVVFVFLLSWAPTYLIFARLKLAAERPAWEDWLIVNMMPFAQWLGSCNSCINPILYTFFNRKYKRGFIELLSFMFCCRPLIRSTSSSTANGPHNNNNNNNNNGGAGGQQTQLTGYHSHYHTHATPPQQRLANGAAGYQPCNTNTCGRGAQNGGYSTMTTMMMHTNGTGKMSLQNGNAHQNQQQHKHHRLEINHSFNGADHTSCSRLDRESSAAESGQPMQIDHVSASLGAGNDLTSVRNLQAAAAGNLSPERAGDGGRHYHHEVLVVSLDEPADNRRDNDNVSVIGLASGLVSEQNCDENCKQQQELDKNNKHESQALIVGLRSERSKTFHGHERERPSRDHHRHHHHHHHHRHHHKHKNNHDERQHSQQAPSSTLASATSTPLAQVSRECSQHESHPHKRHRHHHHHHNHHHHHHHHRHQQHNHSHLQVTEMPASLTQPPPQAPPPSSGSVSCSASASLLNQWASGDGPSLAREPPMGHALDSLRRADTTATAGGRHATGSPAHRRRAFTSSGTVAVAAARRHKRSGGSRDCCCSCQVVSSAPAVTPPLPQSDESSSKRDAEAQAGRAGSLPSAGIARLAASGATAAAAAAANDAAVGRHPPALACSVETALEAASAAAAAAAIARSRASSLGLEIKLQPGNGRPTGQTRRV